MEPEVTSKQLPAYGNHVDIVSLTIDNQKNGK